MPTVTLPGPLRVYTDGEARHEVDASTVTGALTALQRRHPGLAGFVLDEQGSLRRHLCVFVNGTQSDQTAQLGADDELTVLTNISGGSGEIELLVGTRKGLVVLRGGRGDRLHVAERAFAGVPCEYAIVDRRTGLAYASVADPHFGPRVHIAESPAGPWRPSAGPTFPEETGASVERVWVIQPGERDGELWAGVDPAALFHSTDAGETWSLVQSLWDVPSRPEWGPGAGGLCLHTICTWPGEPDRLLVGISAAGIWLTEDGCRTWEQGNAGLAAPYLPEDFTPTFEFCIHHVERAPTRPERLFMQFHGGVYRSDDAGRSWTDIAPGLPSKFGFPIVNDPRDPERAFVIPLSADTDRVTPGGALRVWETTDAGSSWTGHTDGLPQAETYLTILRQAFCHDGADPLGLYFGTTSGELFGSADGGANWHTAADRLPPILSVRAA